MKWWGLLPALFVSGFSSAHAGVVINEFLANPSSGNGEWVEIFNTGPDSVDLSTYSLEDNKSPKKSLSAMGNLLANSYSVYDYSSDGWLNNTKGDSVILKNGNITVDQYVYSSDQKENISLGRSPNGTGEFVSFSNPSKGSPNSEPIPTPTPTPTSTPTPAPTPTSTPKPLPALATPKALQAGTPTPTPKPPAPTEVPLQRDEVGTPTPVTVTVTATPSPTPAVLPAQTSTPNLDWLAMVAVILGGGVFSFSLWHIIKGYVRPPLP